MTTSTIPPITPTIGKATAPSIRPVSGRRVIMVAVGTSVEDGLMGAADVITGGIVNATKKLRFKNINSIAEYQMIKLFFERKT